MCCSVTEYQPHCIVYVQKRSRLRSSRGLALVSLIIVVPILLMFVLWGASLGLRTIHESLTEELVEIMAVAGSGRLPTAYSDGISYDPDQFSPVLKQISGNMRYFLNMRLGEDRYEGIVATFGFYFDRHLPETERILRLDVLTNATFYSPFFCSPKDLVSDITFNPNRMRNIKQGAPPADAFQMFSRLRSRAKTMALRCLWSESSRFGCQSRCAPILCTCAEVNYKSAIPGFASQRVDACTCKEATGYRARLAGSEGFLAQREYE